MLSPNSTAHGASTPTPVQVLKSLLLCSTSDSIYLVACLASPLTTMVFSLFLAPGDINFLFSYLVVYFICCVIFFKHLSVLGMMGAFHNNLVHHSGQSYTEHLKSQKAVKWQSLNKNVEIICFASHVSYTALFFHL